jgi:hypothetical protein
LQKIKKNLNPQVLFVRYFDIFYYINFFLYNHTGFFYLLYFVDFFYKYYFIRQKITCIEYISLEKKSLRKISNKKPSKQSHKTFFVFIRYYFRMGRSLRFLSNYLKEITEMKHAPHSLLALLTVLSLSESAHGTGRPPAAAVVQRDEEKERDDQIDGDAILARDILFQDILAQESAHKRLAKQQKKQRKMARASAASLADQSSRQAPRSGYEVAAASATDPEVAKQAQIAEDELYSLKLSQKEERRLQRQEAKNERVARAISEREAEAWLRQEAQRAQGSSAAAASATDSWEDERQRQEAENERVARAISEREAEAWLIKEAQMAQGSSAAAAAAADPRSRQAPRSGYGAAADSPTDSEMAAVIAASLESERRRQEHEGQMARASAASLASPKDSEMAAAFEASLESERRRKEHEGQMARASAASLAKDRPWFLPAGVSPGDSQAVQERKKQQAASVAAESDGSDDESEFNPD